MSFLAEPLGLTPAEFTFHVAKLRWPTWRPKFVTLHNTAEPSLKQWQHFGMGQEEGEQRIHNLNHFYHDKKGWHSGPHIFVAPDFIWIACDLEQDGVHASCFNKTSIGVEMVGDYAVESFTTGDGARVRDNAAAAIGALCHALKIGAETLRFHKDCARDHHDCPGKHVDRADFIARVKSHMGAA